MEQFSAAELIMAEHHHIRETFTQYDLTNSQTERQMLVNGLIDDISRHTKAVREVFLPVVEEQIKRPDLAEEAHKDNDALFALIDKLKSLEPGSEHFDPTLRLIQETMTAHMEVEESLILPLAKQAAGLDMLQLGEKMHQAGAPADKGEQRSSGVKEEGNAST